MIDDSWACFNSREMTGMYLIATRLISACKGGVSAYRLHANRIPRHEICRSSRSVSGALERQFVKSSVECQVIYSKDVISSLVC